ncbi:MAG TPA: SDR family NAD(P)-dependent oxidoreductase [Rhizomicrobium sp.]|jgi:NAD(P)-dependent dehydrogenase (short-subunit alcohol dehydrogenase family)|nr:SDR family NAD(P)-dependent oxidoreductase [Rhizomicrobium sp.]
MNDLRGKTAFVTGGASGIGLGMARAFGREGMNVVIADIDEKAAKGAVERLASEQIKAAPVIIDVADRGSVRAAALEALAAFGKVHVLCNNAGIAVGGPLGTVKERDWDWIIDVNLKGVVYGTEVFAPLIRSHGEGGHIVNTASLAGMVSAPGMEAYSATKFAVVAMSEGWAIQLAPDGIGVSVLCPGFVRTRIYDSGRARQDRYGGQGEVDPGVGATREQTTQAVLAGIDPDIVGARVVEAMKAGELYIFTHPNFRPIVEMRLNAIRAGFDAADQSQALKAVKEWPPIPMPVLGRE